MRGGGGGEAKTFEGEVEVAAEGELKDTQRTVGEQEYTQASKDEEPTVTKMISICAPQVRGRGLRDKEELLNSESNIRWLRREALASHPPLLRNQELLDESALDTSTEEDAEGVELGEIEYLGTEAAEVAVGEAVVDGEAVREEEEETL